MKRFSAFLGFAALIFISFGVISAGLISHEFYSLIHFVLGTICVVLFIAGGGIHAISTAAIRRTAGFGTGATVYSVVFLGLLVLINVVVQRHDFLHYDSTEQKVYTLSPQTVSLLNRLDKPVLARAFYIGGKVDPGVKELLDRFARQSSKFSWKVVDPEKLPQLVAELGITDQGTLHFAYDEENTKRIGKISGTIGEQEIINAMLKLTRGGSKTIYTLQGHGERDLTDEHPPGFLFLKDAIEGESLTLKPLAIRAGEGIPKDASAVLILTPQKNLAPFETEAIRNYLAGGGNGLFLLDPKTTDDIQKLVKPLGIEVGNDIIVDEFVRLFAGPGLGVQPIVRSYANHSITKGFDQDTLFSTVSSVRAGKEIPTGGSVTELAFTSDKSWAETDLVRIFADEPRAVLEDSDIKGPVSIAAAFEGPVSPAAPPQGETAAAVEKVKSVSRVVVIGDSDFVANVNIKQSFNQDFVLNCLNWVIGESEAVTIRARTLRQSLRGLTNDQVGLMFLSGAIILPELILLLGLGVWWRRR